MERKGLREIDCVHIIYPQATSNITEENLDVFVERETSNYCLHVQTLLALNSSEFPVTNVSPRDPDEVTVDILSITPFRAAVYDGTSYGMIVRVHYGSQVHFRCTTCSIQS